MQKKQNKQMSQQVKVTVELLKELFYYIYQIDLLLHYNKQFIILILCQSYYFNIMLINRTTTKFFIVLALFIFSLSLNGKCWTDNLPNIIYQSARITQNYLSLEPYIENLYPLQNEFVSNVIQKLQNYQSLSFNKSSTVLGCYYPIHIHYVIQNKTRLTLQMRNMTNFTKVNSYSFDLNASYNQCKVVLKNRLFNQYQMFNIMEYLLFCTNQTKQIVFSLHLTFNSQTKQNDGYIQQIKIRSNEPKNKQTTIKLSDSNSQIIVSRLITSLKQNQSYLQIFVNNYVSYIDYEFMSKQYFLSSFSILDFEVSSKKSEQISILPYFIQKNYGLMYWVNGLYLNYWSIPNQHLLKISTFCWNQERIAVRSQNFIYFLQLRELSRSDFVSPYIGFFQLYKVQKQYKNNTDLFTIGQYLIQSNGVNWHIFFQQQGQIKQMLVKMQISSKQIYVDSELCASNSFYVNNIKYSIQKMKMTVTNQTKVITIVDTLNSSCRKTIEVVKLSDGQIKYTGTNRTFQSFNNQVLIDLQGLYAGDRISGTLSNDNITNKTIQFAKLINFKVNGKIIDFVQIQFQQSQSQVLIWHTNQALNNSLVLSVCSSKRCKQIASINLKNYIFSILSYSENKLRGFPLGVITGLACNSQNCYYLKVTVGSSQYFHLDYTQLKIIQYEQPFFISMFAPQYQQTMYQSSEYLNVVNRFAHKSHYGFLQNQITHLQVYIKVTQDSSVGQKMYHQFQSDNFKICPFNQDNTAIFYRFDSSNKLTIMKIAQKHMTQEMSLYKIQFVNEYPEYYNSTLQCVSNLIVIQTKNLVQIYDRSMVRIRSILIQSKYQSNNCKFNSRYVICQNIQAKELSLFSLQTGFNIKLLKNITFEDIILKSIEPNLLLKNGSLLVIQNDKMILQTTDNNFFIRVQNEQKSDFKIYEIKNVDTVTPLDNFWPLKVEPKFIDDIWNCSVATTLVNNQIQLKHLQFKKIQLEGNPMLQLTKQFIFNNKILALSFVQPQQNYQYSYLYFESIENNKSKYIDYRMISEFIGIVGVSNLIQTDNTFVVLYKSIYQIIIERITYNVSSDKIVSKNFTFYKQKLPTSYLMHNKDRVFFDGRFVYTLQNGLPNWNSTFNFIRFKRFYPDVLFHQESHKKIVIYSLQNDSNKYQQISQFSSYKMSLINQQLIDFVQYKDGKQNRTFLIILFQNTLVVQEYPLINNTFLKYGLSEISTNNYNDFVKINVDQTGQKIVILSKNKNHILLYLNLTKFPSMTECIYGTKILVTDREAHINSGILLNNLLISYSDQQIFVHHTQAYDRKVKNIFVVQKLTIQQMITNFNKFQGKSDVIPTINQIRKVNSTFVKVMFQQMSYKSSFKFYSILESQLLINVKSYLQIDSKVKSLTIKNSKYQRAYSIQLQSQIENIQTTQIRKDHKDMSTSDYQIRNIERALRFQVKQWQKWQEQTIQKNKFVKQFLQS